jgi:hypothetical protein
MAGSPRSSKSSDAPTSLSIHERKRPGTEPNQRPSDVVLYSIEERVSLWSMSDDDFYSRFRDFSYLLVEQHGRTVVAASHSGNCPEMLEEFLGQNPTAVTRDLIFWSGPKALARTAAGDISSRDDTKAYDPHGRVK